MLERIEWLIFTDAITARASGDFQIVHDHAHGFSHSDSRDHEVGPTQAEGGESYKKRCQHGDGCAADKAEVRAVPVLHQERRSVGAQSEEDGKTKRDLARHPAEQVPA